MRRLHVARSVSRWPQSSRSVATVAIVYEVVKVKTSVVWPYILRYRGAEGIYQMHVMSVVNHHDASHGRSEVLENLTWMLNRGYHTALVML